MVKNLKNLVCYPHILDIFTSLNYHINIVVEICMKIWFSVLKSPTYVSIDSNDTNSMYVFDILKYNK